MNARAIVVWLAVPLIALAFATSARPEDPVVVRVGVEPTITQTTMYIGQQMGFFSAEGLDVRFVPFDSAANMIVPLGAGQLDVGGGAPAAGLYNAVARGINVRAVADLGSDAPGFGFQQLVVRTDLVKSGRFRTIKDLKGMTVAVVTPGATVAPMLNALLVKAGLTYDDVRRLQMPNPDKPAALRNGSIDATLLPEPNASLALKSGVAVRIMGDDEFYPNQQIGVVLYGSTFLKQRDLAVRFMRGYIRASRFYSDALRNAKLHGPQTAKILDILKTETGVADRSVLSSMTLSRSDPNGHLNVASMNADLDFFRQQGLIEGSIKAQDVVDESYVADALKQLGAYVPKAR